MRSVENTFTKAQLKGISFILAQTEYKYRTKYDAIIDLLKSQGFIAVRDGKKYKILPDPDYVEVTEE